MGEMDAEERALLRGLRSLHNGRVGSDGELSEAAWQDDIIKAALLAGWEAHHVHDSRRSLGDGWPDVVFAKPGFPLIYAELKRHNGVTSPKQKHWLTLLCYTVPAPPVYLWRCPRLMEGQAVWREITDIFIHGPGAIGRDETTRWQPETAHLLPPETLRRRRKPTKLSRLPDATTPATTDTHAGDSLETDPARASQSNGRRRNPRAAGTHTARSRKVHNEHPE